jgi:NTP pyrophosphatase (non-canonical NTP hydrolase)
MTETNRTLERHFNGLTPKEAELLALLSEECGELVQAIGKVLRHGFESYHPECRGAQITNRENLVREMGDVSAAIELLIGQTKVNGVAVHRAMVSKLDRVGSWLHHVRDKS